MLYAIDFEDKETNEMNCITMIADSKREAWDKTRNLYGDCFQYELKHIKKLQDSNKVHQIWFKSKMPDGSRIQLEVWPSGEKEIGVYPVCKVSNSPFIKTGETFRLTLHKIPQDKVYDLYHSLIKGDVTLTECKEYFYNGDKDTELLDV